MHKKNSRKGAMKGWIATALLSAFLIGAVMGAAVLRGKINALRAENEAAVGAAQQQLDEAKAAHDAIDPSTAQGAEVRLRNQKTALEAAKARVQRLQDEIATMEEEADRTANQADAMEADEDTSYYIAAYKSMEEGMEMVKGYVEGN